MLDGRWRTQVGRRVHPIGESLHRRGVRADAVTATGVLLSIVASALAASGELVAGAAVLGACGACDALDGAIAKASGSASPRGAFFDSVSDRVSDFALLGGVGWYLGRDGGRGPMLAMAVLATSALISYQRARAESLGFEARGGLMERAERMVVLGLGMLFNVLVPVLWLMLATTSLTAVQRFARVWRQATPTPLPRAPRRARRDRRPRVVGGVAEPRLRRWWAPRNTLESPGWRARLRRHPRARTRPPH